MGKQAGCVDCLFVVTQNDDHIANKIPPQAAWGTA